MNDQAILDELGVGRVESLTADYDDGVDVHEAGRRLIECARANDADGARDALADGADPSVELSRPLTLFAQKRNATMVETLLDCGAEATVENVLAAVAAGDGRCVAILFRAYKQATRDPLGPVIQRAADCAARWRRYEILEGAVALGGTLQALKSMSRVDLDSFCRAAPASLGPALVSSFCAKDLAQVVHSASVTGNGALSRAIRESAGDLPLEPVARRERRGAMALR